MIEENQIITISGQINSNKKSILNPDILKNKNESQILFKENSSDLLFPIYSESKSVSSRFFYYFIQKCFTQGLHTKIKDPIPQSILDTYHLPKLETALVWIHAPKSMDDALAARKRFAFQEIFFIEIERIIARNKYRQNGAYSIDKSPTDFIENLDFKLTKNQESVLSDVLGDIKQNIPMTRLLEGDVGSGKTAIAGAAIYAAVNTHAPSSKNETLQVAYMAPTEILANQHFETFCNYFKNTHKTIGLITSSGCKKFPAKSVSMKRNDISWTNVSRAQLLKWAKDGSVDILIGTHSLMNKSVVMRHLALAVIDEQHRFGTKQRHALINKDGLAPHLLSMTATPIPRTLALTIFGDLDLSLLTEMPPGRKPIITKSGNEINRKDVYIHLKEELTKGRQAYVICPRINESDDEDNLKNEQNEIKNAPKKRAVVTEAKRLAEKELKGYRIGVLHGKLKPSEKEDIMDKFLRHEIDVLVATSVVEVGVNVPNASMIIIEEAERFGMAQLHQLRGRVIRGTHQSYCYLMSISTNEKSLNRLTKMVESKNGFELAEADMMERGPGHFAGVKQSGISDLAMEALKNIRLVEAAKKEAKKILDEDINLNNYETIKEYIEQKEKTIHFE
jgi:ATP-dependent DNA helicase RecG